MSTYLQGVQDSVEYLRPPQQNLQQNAQMLQTMQSRYDQNHDKLNTMYGKILNAGLTRENNIKARDEFFKLIDSDIQKIGNMDLSKHSNQEKAQGVFQQIYNNDYLVKDMVWSKNYQEQMKRAEAFKNCVDPKECGGQYWDEGVKYMQYKRQEFAETDNADSLTFSNVEYVPYNNVMEKALADFKEMGGYDMTTMSMSPDGKYQVTTKNGQQSIQPLTAMFDKLYSENPQLQKQFEIMAHNQRKDWAASKVASGEFESMNEAEVNYIKKKAEALNQQVIDISERVGADVEVIDKKLQALEQLKQNGKMKEGSKEHKQYMELSGLKQLSDRAKAFTETAKGAMKKMNNHRVVRNIGAQMDQAASAVLLDQEIGQAAGILAYKDYEVSVEEDEFAMLQTKHQYNVALEGVKHSNRMKMEEWKLRKGHNSYKNKDSKPVSVDKAIDEEFKDLFGASGSALADIKAKANKRYPPISSADITAAGSDPNSKGRKEREDLKNKRDAKRAEFIMKEKARLIDSKLGTKWERTRYNQGGNAILGQQPSVNTTENTNQNNNQSEDVTFADMSFGVNDISDELVGAVASGHANPKTKAYYQGLADNAKKKGMSVSQYIKTKPKAEQDKITANFGKRLDQAEKAASGDDGWQQTWETVLDKQKAGRAAKMIQEGLKATAPEKRKIAKKLTLKYLDQDGLDENSDEYKELAKSVENLILKYGEVEGSTLRYNGQDLGLVYYQPTEGDSYELFRGTPGVKYDRNGTSPYERRLKLVVPGRTHSLNKEMIKKIINSNNSKGYDRGAAFADVIFKNKIKNNIALNESDFFKSSVAKNLLKEYENYDLTTQIYTDSKKETRENVVNAMAEEMGKGDIGEYFEQYSKETNYEASDFVDANGNWNPNPTTTNEETRQQAYKAYKEAMDRVYVEKGDEYYMPGIGNRYAKKMSVQRPDLSPSSSTSSSWDIRNYLINVQAANLQADGAFRINNRTKYDQAQLDRIINEMLDGEIEIETVNYTPIGGTASKSEVGKEYKGDWQRMEIFDDKGTRYTFDLHNGTHNSNILLGKASSSLRTQALNAAGHYNYISEGDVLTNNAPVSIQKTGRNSLEVVGEIWRWDETLQRGVYQTYSDIFEEHGVNLNGLTAEKVEENIQAIIDHRLESFSKHTPTVQ